MSISTIRNGPNMLVGDGPRASFLLFSSEVVAHNVQRGLKEIDSDLQAARLELFRKTFGNGVLGIFDENGL